MGYCQNCGAEHPDGAKFCSDCGTAQGTHTGAFGAVDAEAAHPDAVQVERVIPGGGNDMPVNQTIANKIENHLVKAIIAAVCCCLPFGIVSIVYAAQVDTKSKAGDISGALESSKKASLWGNVAIGVGILWNVLCIVGYSIIGFGAFMESVGGGLY